jgi:hypothetical protein
MAQRQTLGHENLINILRQLPKRMQKKVFQDASMTPARMIARAGKARLENSSAFRNKGTDDGYSKLLQVATSIKPKRLRGVVAVQPGWRAPDLVRVKGSTRPKWTNWGWANLLAKGRGGGKEGGRGRGRSRDTGTTRGAGDYIAQGYRDVASSAKTMYTKNISRVVARNIKRLNKIKG